MLTTLAKVHVNKLPGYVYHFKKGAISLIRTFSSHWDIFRWHHGSVVERLTHHVMVVGLNLPGVWPPYDLGHCTYHAASEFAQLAGVYKSLAPLNTCTVYSSNSKQDVLKNLSCFVLGKEQVN